MKGFFKLTKEEADNFSKTYFSPNWRWVEVVPEQDNIKKDKDLAVERCQNTWFNPGEFTIHSCTYATGHDGPCRALNGNS